MGRPKDAKERLWQRAAEDVDRALRRKDAPGAAEHLLTLPKDRRDPLLPQVMALFHADVLRSHAEGSIAGLTRWAVWADAEPRFLMGREPALLWCLLMGTLHSKDWQRSRRLLDLNLPDLSRRSPALLAWLEAWIEHRGQIPPVQAAALPKLPKQKEIPQTDPRLGYEPARAAPPIPVPRTGEEAARSVRRLFRSERRPSALRDMLTQWRRLSPETAEAIAIQAVPLLLREALLATQAEPDPPGAKGRARLAAAVPLLAVAELVVGAPTELSADIFLALRLSSAALPVDLWPNKADGSLEALLVLLSVAGVAVRYPEHRQAVADRLAGTDLPQEMPKETLDRALPVLQTLLAHIQTPALAVKALSLWALDAGTPDGGLGPAPNWLAGVLRQVAADGDALAAYLRRARSKERARFLGVVGISLPTQVGELILARGLESADEEGRREFGGLLMTLLDREDPGDIDALARERGLAPERATFSELFFLMQQSGLDFAPGMKMSIRMMPPKDRLPMQLWSVYLSLKLNGGLAPPYGPVKRSLLARFQDRLLPYRVELLQLAFSQTPGQTDRLRLIDVFLAGRSDIEARLQVLKVLCCPNCEPNLYRVVEDRMVTEYGRDPLALSRALLRMEETGVKDAGMRALANALIEADRNFAGRRTPEYEKALYLTQRLAARMKVKTKAMKPRAVKPKAPAKAKEAKAPAKAKEAKMPAKAKEPKAPSARKTLKE